MPIDTNALTVSLAAVNETLRRITAKIKEQGGNNRGPQIDPYAIGVGLDPTTAPAWCTSGMYDVFKVVSAALAKPNPFPRTAKAVHVWQVLYKTCYEPNPAPGFIYVLDHGNNILTEWKTDRYTDDGHLGIVTAVDSNGIVTEGSGNTNLAGSREGNAWGLHIGSPEVSHGGLLLGYLNLEKIA